MIRGKNDTVDEILLEDIKEFILSKEILQSEYEKLKDLIERDRNSPGVNLTDVESIRSSTEKISEKIQALANLLRNIVSKKMQSQKESTSKEELSSILMREGAWIQNISQSFQEYIKNWMNLHREEVQKEKIEITQTISDHETYIHELFQATNTLIDESSIKAVQSIAL